MSQFRFWQVPLKRAILISSILGFAFMSMGALYLPSPVMLPTPLSPDMKLQPALEGDLNLSAQATEKKSVWLKDLESGYRNYYLFAKSA